MVVPFMSTVRGVAWLYLKICLFTGIAFILLMGLYYLIVSALLIHMVYLGLIFWILIVHAGIFFGVAMSLIMGTLHIMGIKSKHYPVSDEALDVRQKREIFTDLPYDEIFNACISSIDAVKKGRIVSEDRTKGRIDAQTGWSWKSWGEKISFDIRKQAGDKSVISVTSRPKVGTTLVDYGKNLDNVEKISIYLKNHQKNSAMH